MTTFKELYSHLLNKSIHSNMEDLDLSTYNFQHLDCLLHPEQYPIPIRVGECTCKPGESICKKSCLFNAIQQDENGNIQIDESLCVGCSQCVQSCKNKNIVENTSVLSVLHALKNAKSPIYALIAPSFQGQFSKEVTPGMLRSAFKELGFAGMIEVAVFADILTIKEALEFDKHILKSSDYQLTSCCCPIWISMIKKSYKSLMNHIPAAVSPMIACARTVKYLHPDAITVFIGPCMAKKAEAREADIKDAVDYVLTFQEINDIFKALEIDLSQQQDSEKYHSSRSGRTYAYAGGVSQAVKDTVARLNPDRQIKVITRKADGVNNCRQMIDELINGNGKANFYEGMGCVGGCVGGPKVIVDRDTGYINVEEYGATATYKTPLDNPYVYELLERLGLSTIESLLYKSELFTRNL